LAGETLLVIDGARLGHAVWLRPTEVWGRAAAATRFEWETLPFLGVAVVISSLDDGWDFKAPQLHVRDSIQRS